MSTIARTVNDSMSLMLPIVNIVELNSQNNISPRALLFVSGFILWKPVYELIE